ncbi:killer cell lectin-like receptor subfamily B member 1C isoform X1 [Geospiza fortis]|uniref:Killer cell lectin-like receptor subfamily B member 1C isoform X1 n=1 Tax=Geospiza fortis TaxID=48883 RepID=A0A8N5I5D9_GEOFO|nr:killer cell lectin-like receptor subfamily B member 1C isoform X1 [Geospiza fortis]
MGTPRWELPARAGTASSGRCGGSCARPEVTQPPGGSFGPPPDKEGPEIPSGAAALPQPPGPARVPAESEGCRLCAVGWRLLGAKCYWISDGMNPWNRSREDCRDRGSELLMPRDQDELEFLNESLQNPTRHFWIGLSVPVAGTGWMWENGSDLGQERFQLELGKEPGSCGTLRGNGISPQSCASTLQWICQKESIEI